MMCDYSVGDRDFAGSVVSVDMYNLCIIYCSPENSAPSICLPIKILLAMIITPAHWAIPVNGDTPPRRSKF